MRAFLKSPRFVSALSLAALAAMAACSRDATEPSTDPPGGGATSSGGGESSGSGGSSGDDNGIRPQPQPNPAKLPSLAPAKVTVRAVAGDPDSVALAGAAGAVDPPALATKITLVTLRRLVVVTVPVAADGSFEAVLPGRAGDRLTATAGDAASTWPASTVEVGAAGLAVSTECLGLSPAPSGAAPGEVGFSVYSNCAATEQLDVVYSTDALHASPVSVPPKGAATVVTTWPDGLSGTYAAALVDIHGVRRLGAFVGR